MKRVGLLIGLLLLNCSFASEPREPVTLTNITLEECIQFALKNNKQHEISALAIKIADAKHQQALSAWYPRVAFQASLSRLDQNPSFVFPKEKSNYSVAGLPIPNFPVGTPLPLSVTIPEKQITLLDRDNLNASLEITYPLFTGFKRSAIVRQSELNQDLKRIESTQTDQKIICDISKYYYAVVLAQNVRKIAKDALERLEVTNDLTRRMYENGTGRVKKTDFLKNELTVETARSMVAELEGNVDLAKSALLFAMGLQGDNELSVSSLEIPCDGQDPVFAELVSKSLNQNSDWQRIELAKQICSEQVREAESDLYPMIGLFGKVTHIENKYDAGMVSPDDKDNWVFGIGVQYTLFDGLRTDNKITETSLRLEQLTRQQELLKAGLELQLKQHYLNIVKTAEQVVHSQKALKAAKEYRDLSERAYREEMVETREVIESQIYESMAGAQYQKALYDHICSKINLDLLIGNNQKH